MNYRESELSASHLVRRTWPESEEVLTVSSSETDMAYNFLQMTRDTASASAIITVVALPADMPVISGVMMDDGMFVGKFSNPKRHSDLFLEIFGQKDSAEFETCENVVEFWLNHGEVMMLVEV